MAFRIETSEEFEREAESILEWLFPRALGLRKAVEGLAIFPLGYPLSPENADFSFEVRQLLYGRKPHIYRVLFTVEAETVYVLHLRHGRRLPLMS
jgi:hypothetical protein